MELLFCLKQELLQACALLTMTKTFSFKAFLSPGFPSSLAVGADWQHKASRTRLLPGYPSMVEFSEDDNKRMKFLSNRALRVDTLLSFSTPFLTTERRWRCWLLSREECLQKCTSMDHGGSTTNSRLAQRPSAL